MLLLKVFDSVSHTLSLLSKNLYNTLQGARELAKPPILSEILYSNSKKKNNNKKKKKKKMNIVKGRRGNTVQMHS
ncbi:hypothetical protein IGI04_017853 [Brassica rapa subsp. trilocularis]|uniref:Uncharacterized protein n=1 Tax=Brassica rapa subsp. trilocularis TaxID=1813537 RepID=A0ABQ7LG42_BRACM|nr:hypothetical protein IGI04_036993 [Brassica rapa subsp. trilocularis]KAG5396039.1 hypothetical protein IGI04_017853 [Brassica rapa subsp. trilocularis]